MKSSLLAVIGGSGFALLPEFELLQSHMVATPFGEPSAPILEGMLNGQKLLLLSRHGLEHQIPPHRINYRANLWALHSLGVTEVIAVAAVGGIHPECVPGKLVVPDQVVDYTWGRESSFFSEDFSPDKHIDFTWPYDQTLRQRLIAAAAACGIPMRPTGTYAATQGPRLETAAEISRLSRDGCDLVGMTGMPEAVLARELDMAYACCAVVANLAAGLVQENLSMQQIQATLADAMSSVHRVIEALTRAT